jgi:hypothetical protein
MASNQRRLAEWEARLARWRTSGTSIRQFCLDEGVCEPSGVRFRAVFTALGHAPFNIPSGDATCGIAPPEPKPWIARLFPMEFGGEKTPKIHELTFSAPSRQGSEAVC